MNASKSTPVGSWAGPALRRHCFTLVEMMVVIVIIAIVVGISVPAFQRMGSGSSVRAGTRVLSGQIRLTRQFAISQRRTVALILPADDVTGLPDDLRYVAMKPAIVRVPAGSPAYDFEFVEWVDGTRWLHIARGAAIAEVDGDEGISDGTNWTATPSDDSITTVGIAPDQMTDLHDGLSGSTKAPVRAIVFSPTGRLQGGGDAWATVAQIQYDPSVTGNWIRKNPGVSGPGLCTPNQFNIHVNQFTGRIRIETVDEY